MLTPLFYEDPPYIATPSLFHPHPTPTLLSPPTPQPNCSFCCWVSFAECVVTPYLKCYFLLNDNMDLHMPSLGTLVPEGPWCVFYATRCQVTEVWHIMCIFTGTLIWYYSHKHTQHTRASRLTHPTYIFTPPVVYTTCYVI